MWFQIQWPPNNFWSAEFSLLRAESFSCSWDTGKCNFLYQKKKKLSTVFFFFSFTHQNHGSVLDPEPDWIQSRMRCGAGCDPEPDLIRSRIRSGAGLDPDPDPYPDSGSRFTLNDGWVNSDRINESGSTALVRWFPLLFFVYLWIWTKYFFRCMVNLKLPYSTV